MLPPIFDSIADHRITGRCTYVLSELLTIALLTYLSNGEDYVDMSDFAEERARDFGLLLHNDTSPSPDTFERLMAAVNPDKIWDKDLVSKWIDLKTIVELESEVTQKKTGETTITKRYYISDENFPKAAYYNMLARGHWTIENLLHWHLDVTFLEDASRARKGNAAQNLSLIRKLALQVVRNYSDKRSIRKRLFKASLNEEYMIDMVKNYNF